MCILTFLIKKLTGFRMPTQEEIDYAISVIDKEVW